VNSFEHRLGEARYDGYLPQDVLPALDAAEAAAVARLEVVTGSDGRWWRSAVRPRRTTSS
jgi:hypothetical protein